MTQKSSTTIPDFSALCFPPEIVDGPTFIRQTIRDWQVETDSSLNASRHPIHECFDPIQGVYTVRSDGIYSIKVEYIPIGGARLSFTARKRQQVSYAVRIQSPGDEETDDEFVDIGPTNYYQTHHLKTNTCISCVRMTTHRPPESLRLKVEMVFRKKKRPYEPPDRRPLRKRQRRVDNSQPVFRRTTTATPPGSGSDDDDSDDKEWQDGFSSDTSADGLP